MITLALILASVAIFVVCMTALVTVRIQDEKNQIALTAEKVRRRRIVSEVSLFMYKHDFMLHSGRTCAEVGCVSNFDRLRYWMREREELEE